MFIQRQERLIEGLHSRLGTGSERFFDLTKVRAIYQFGNMRGVQHDFYSGDELTIGAANQALRDDRPQVVRTSPYKPGDVDPAETD